MLPHPRLGCCALQDGANKEQGMLAGRMLEDVSAFAAGMAKRCTDAAQQHGGGGGNEKGET